MMVTLSSTSLDETTIGQQHVVLQTQLILRYKMRDSAGLTNMLQQQCSKAQMPSQAYANYAIYLRVEPPINFLCHVLVFVRLHQHTRAGCIP